MDLDGEKLIAAFSSWVCFEVLFFSLSLRLWLDDLTSNVCLLILLVPFTGRSTTPHQQCYFQCLYRFTIISSYNTVDCAKTHFSHLSPCALNLPSLRGRYILLSLNDSVVLKCKQLKRTSFHQLAVRIFFTAMIDGDNLSKRFMEGTNVNGGNNSVKQDQ